MFRRSTAVFVSAIPRSAWDPSHHNTNWSDSYATDIADRRHWPAKKWSIGLEPRTPRDWLRFSYRNLAYAYNGALRACTSFPEMLGYYREMKQRGVKVDVDTLNVLLTRAARYEHIQTDDIFLLFDEMVSLGARPDIASVETLHTVLEHSAGKPFEWREARRRQLVELYNYLAIEEIERLAPHKADTLLAAQLKRLRSNMRQLSSSLSPSVYRRYFSVIDSGERLIEETHNFLWEFVTPDHPALEIPSLQLRIPFVASVLKRPPLDADPATLKPTDFEDTDVCSVIQAAVERCIDGDLHDHRDISERRMYLSLLTMLTSSGVLYTADLVAQLMDIVKYSPLDSSRDADAQRLLRYALRGSSAAQDEAYRALWRKVQPAVDARVVGRYISARNPWSTMRICFDERFMFRSYPAAQLITATSSSSGSSTTSNAQRAAKAKEREHESVKQPRTSGESVEGVEESIVMEVPATAAESSMVEATTSSSGGLELKTAEGLKLRWDDVNLLVRRTNVVSRGAHTQNKMEVFTGKMVFLRTVATGQRYGSPEAAFATQAVGDDASTQAKRDNPSNSSSSTSATGVLSTLFADGLGFDVWESVFAYTREVYNEMEHYIAEANSASNTGGAGATTLEPEFECWESMLVVLRCILDYCVLHAQRHGKASAGGDGGGAAEELFKEAAELRARLVEESRTRFSGRMRILWLQEV